MSKRIGLMASAAVIWSATAATAELTAPALWAEWQDMQQSFGTTMTAETERYANGVLTLTNVSTSASLDQVESNGRISEIVLREMDGGRVRVELAPVYALSMVDSSFGETTVTTMELRHDGLEIIASGDDAERVYDYSADGLVVEVGDVLVDGETMPFALSVTVTDLSSRYTIDQRDAQRSFTSSDTAGAVRVLTSAQDPVEGQLDLAYQLNDASSMFNGNLSALGNAGIGALPFGRADTLLQGEFTHSGSSLEAQVQAPDGGLQLEARTGAGKVALDMLGRDFGFESDTQTTEMRALVDGFPMPLEASIGRTTLGLGLPLSPSGAPTPVKLTLGLRDVVLSDVLWGLFDPQGLIQRDPATIAIDLEGTATLLTDLTDSPEELVLLEGPPGELNTLRINELEISVGGAELTGTGAASFDNSAGMPMPVGRVKLQLIGGFALLEQLAALGLVPPDQVSMVQMMSGMFAIPTGPDTLASEIEFVPGGGVLINGMPLQ